MTTTNLPIGDAKALSDTTRVRELILACLWTGAILVVGIGAGLFMESSAMLRASQQVIRTQETVTELENTLSLVKDAETGQRGYLLTGKSFYLRPYDTAPEKVAEGMKQLEGLLQSEPEELQLLKEAEAATQEKFNELKLTIDLQRKEGTERALEEVQKDRGVHYMRLIRQLFDQLENDQRSRLGKALFSFERSSQTSLCLFASLVVSAGILFGAFVYLLRRYIREMLRAANMIERQSHLMTSILTSISDGVVVSDTAGKLLLVNKAFENLTGVSGTETPPGMWSQTSTVYHGDGKTPYADDELPLYRATRGESVVDAELIIYKHNMQESIAVKCNSRPLIDPVSGERLGGVVVIHDVTQDKAVQNRMREFYGVLSHELRTPLTSIKGSLDLIMGGVAGEISDTTRDLVEISLVESDRMLRMINELLDLRKIEAGEMKLKLHAITANDLVRAVLAGIKGFAAQTNVEIVSEINFNPLIACDIDRIQQVLGNLLSNALKFSMPSQTVHLSVDKVADTEVKFSVKDSGAGIPENQQGRVFQKFQQFKASASDSHKGTGLGLAIAKSIVEQHGGQIGFESHENVGSTFWFILPLESIAAEVAK